MHNRGFVLSETMAKADKNLELWVGTLNGIPVVGFSQNMVDGFLALLKGDRKTAEAKGLKALLGSLPDLKPESLLQTPGSVVINGLHAKVVEALKAHIKQVAKPGSQKNVSKARGVRTAEQTRKTLIENCTELRAKLREENPSLPEVVKMQEQRSGRGEHVFQRNLLIFYRSIIEEFVRTHVVGGYNSNFVGALGNAPQVQDAFARFDSEGTRINLTLQQRRNIDSWVAHIPNDTVYYSYNNDLYSELTRNFRATAVEYMQAYCRGQNYIHVGDLNNMINLMIEHRVYLDPIPTQLWLSDNTTLLTQFQQTETAVQGMLRQLTVNNFSMLTNWVDEIRRGAGVRFNP